MSVVWAGSHTHVNTNSSVSNSVSFELKWNVLQGWESSSSPREISIINRRIIRDFVQLLAYIYKSSNNILWLLKPHRKTACKKLLVNCFLCPVWTTSIGFGSNPAPHQEGLTVRQSSNYTKNPNLSTFKIHIWKTSQKQRDRSMKQRALVRQEVQTQRPIKTKLTLQCWRGNQVGSRLRVQLQQVPFFTDGIRHRGKFKQEIGLVIKDREEHEYIQ